MVAVAGTTVGVLNTVVAVAVAVLVIVLTTGGVGVLVGPPTSASHSPVLGLQV
jgi:hypothetical protein